MDVSDEPERDELERDDETRREPERTPSGRKKRSDAGKSRGGGSGKRAHVSTRFLRRADKAAETVRELIRIRMPGLDVSDLSFVETVDRDAEAWGDFLAQLAEWFVPFGACLDLVFGAALVRVLRVAPSFRAGRRELSERRAERAAARAIEDEDRELRERIAAEHEAARTEGIFAEHPAPPSPAEPELTREEWLASGGNGS